MGGRGSSGGNNPGGSKATAVSNKGVANMTKTENTTETKTLTTADMQGIMTSRRYGESYHEKDFQQVVNTLKNMKNGKALEGNGEKGVAYTYTKEGENWIVTNNRNNDRLVYTSTDVARNIVGSKYYGPSLNSISPVVNLKSASSSTAIPSFVRNSSNPRTVVTKIGSNTYYIDLAKSDVTKANIRSLENAGWKRRGKRDDTWYKG